MMLFAANESEGRISTSVLGTRIELLPFALRITSIETRPGRSPASIIVRIVASAISVDDGLPTVILREIEIDRRESDATKYLVYSALHELLEHELNETFFADGERLFEPHEGQR